MARRGDDSPPRACSPRSCVLTSASFGARRGSAALLATAVGVSWLPCRLPTRHKGSRQQLVHRRAATVRAGHNPAAAHQHLKVRIAAATATFIDRHATLLWPECAHSLARIALSANGSTARQSDRSVYPMRPTRERLHAAASRASRHRPFSPRTCAIESRHPHHLPSCSPIPGIRPASDSPMA